MNVWAGGWRIARFELKNSWLGVLFTLLFFTYIVVIAGPALGHEGILNDTSYTNWLFFDFIYLTVLPNLGFVMNVSFVRYWREDHSSRKLAMWRTMPISMDQIALGRIMQMVLTAVPVAVLFFGMQYWLLGESRAEVPLDGYLSYCLLWFSYSMLVGTGYMLLEYGTSGKKYTLFSFFFLLLYASIILLLWWMEISFLRLTFEWAAAGSWTPALIAAGIAVMALVTGYWILKRRLHRRNFLE
ncbi:hypothetical protein [Paenibacillus tarimensis]|uniref:hypothetical protein n=1 Tax=Paenibacillus tarimensis TaxID=416012 RepID=UPI001F3B1B05|nr:hypothetical protein [Paenibacillus tarimensis]MCF2943441.1 hypothetical protein [Paenibacillus tarimensis]